MKTNTKKLVQVALLIAIEVVLSRFCSISTPIVKIGFGFLPIAMIGMMYGPAYAAVAGGVADFLGAILFPIGSYFPGFTLTAALTGAVYGLLLFRQPKSWLRIFLSAVLVTGVLGFGLNSLWLYMMMQNGVMALLPARFVQFLIMTPIQVIMIRLAWTKVCSTRWMSSLAA